jgi:DDB1- and CUL4-associated factor 15
VSKKSSTSPEEMLEAAAKTYEFSEENEKCEKISLFRKRRLADKKYEFSEENTENIIPYSRIRNKIPKRQQFHPRTSPHTSTFRSPCSSPIPNRSSSSFMSPPGFRSPNYYTYRSSPTRHFLYSPPPRHHSRLGNMSPAYGSEDIHKYFSDIMNRIKDGRGCESGGEYFHDEAIKSSKDAPVFSKKIINYYVEEDDANSTITHDEDDCISPGYHLSLPMEVHGACYSKMQIVSKSSLNRLKHLGVPRAIVTQNSFDIEHFSIHIANMLCKKNEKKYGILFDLAFEIVHVS